MAVQEIERTVRLSFLDRLVDHEPGQGADANVTRKESVRQLKASLHRDLEWLLNTRRIVEPAPDQYPEVQRSVYHYGLPDISSLSADSDAVRQKLVRQVEESVRLFEPRLTGVRVSLAQSDGDGARQIRFLIEGLLRMDPDPERVTFDTVMETASGKFLVSGDGNA